MLSSRRRPITWSDLRVGLFVVVGLAVVAGGILFFHSGEHLGPTRNVRTIFASVGGLTTGASVVMSGVQIGRVTDISFISPDIPTNSRFLDQLKDLKSRMDNLDIKNPTQAQEYERLKLQYTSIQAQLMHIRVLMSVESSYIPFIKSDSIASIQNQGLVGEKQVAITLGTPDSPAPQAVVDENHVSAIEIHSQEAPDLNTMLSNASSATNSLEDILSQVDADIKEDKGTLGKLVKDPALYNSLQQTLQSSARATEYTGELLQSIKEGKGTLGQVFTNPSLYNATTGVMESMQNGKGTIGKLLNDPAVYDNADSAMLHFNGVLDKAENGKGTVHSLLTDEALYHNSTNAMGNLNQLTGSINEGKGTLGKLMHDESLYNNASQSMANLLAISNEIQNEQGSLGLLIRDKTLYQNVTDLSGQMAQFIKDFRKNPRKYLTVQFSVIKIF